MAVGIRRASPTEPCFAWLRAVIISRYCSCLGCSLARRWLWAAAMRRAVALACAASSSQRCTCCCKSRSNRRANSSKSGFTTMRRPFGIEMSALQPALRNQFLTPAAVPPPPRVPERIGVPSPARRWAVTPLAPRYFRREPAIVRPIGGGRRNPVCSAHGAPFWAADRAPARPRALLLRGWTRSFGAQVLAHRVVMRPLQVPLVPQVCPAQKGRQRPVTLW